MFPGYSIILVQPVVVSVPYLAKLVKQNLINQKICTEILRM